MNRFRPSRRKFLRGAGVAIGLPMFESFMPRIAEAQVSRRRLLTLFVPNGMLMEEWTPSKVGPLELSGLAAPFEPIKRKILILSQLANVSGKQKPGDHASGTGAAFTCVKPAKGDGASIRAGVSMDQVAAAALKSQTRIASLQMGSIPGRKTGVCEAGYSCVYENTMSWSDEKTPMPPTHSAAALFNQMFAGFDPTENEAARTQRLARRKSVIDYVREEATLMRQSLGRADGAKLEQMLTGIREVEQRLQSGTGVSAMCGKGGKPGDGDIDYTAKCKLMNDLIVSAFQCDVTRVISHMIAPSYPAIPYNFMGVAAGHHTVSHYIDGRQQGGVGYKDLYRKTQQWHVQMVLDLLMKLDAVSEGSTTLLDSVFVVQSGDVGNPRSHDHDHLAVMVAGGGGLFKMGRHLSYPAGTPIANLFISVLQGLGARATTFGSDGKGPLSDLT